MLGPTTCPVEKRGSSTVKAASSRMTASACSRDVTSQAAERGHERDRLVRAEAMQGGVRIVLQLRDRHGRAEREGVRARHRKRE
jgi:hypothetical protein